MTRVVIANVYPDDNRGSAALTSAAISLVERAIPDAMVTLLALAVTAEEIPTAFRHTLSAHPSVGVLPTPLTLESGRLRGLQVAVGSLKQLAGGRGQFDEGLESVAQADLVVSRGGVIFRRRSVRGLAGLWRTAYPLLFAQRRRIPTITMPTHFGPFAGWASRTLNGLILRNVDVVVARDAVSEDWARVVGVPASRLVSLPDSVFALHSPTREEADAAARIHGLSPGRFGCAVVSTDVQSQPHHDRFMRDFGSALVAALDRGMVDNIAVVVQVDGSLESDLAASQRFIESVNDDRFRMIHDDLSVRDLAALYGSARFTSGTRLHAAILSLLGGTPAFPVNLGLALGIPKASAVFSTVGLDHWVVGFPDPACFGPEALERSVGNPEREMVETTIRKARGDVVGGMVKVIQSAIGREPAR